jgi:predicted transcriptional regulator
VTYCRARRAAQLHVFGLSDEDIAKSLGCSSRTVRNYLAMPEIRERVNAMIEESDRRLAMLRFVSYVSKMTRDSALLDQLEQSIRGSVGRAEENSCACGLKPDAAG